MEAAAPRGARPGCCARYLPCVAVVDVVVTVVDERNAVEAA